MNVLVVVAHHDDLELGCGSTVARLVEGGHRVWSLVLTHSGYSAPDGTIVRSREQALSEGREAARVLGYELIAHDEDTMDVPVSDANTCKILDAVHTYGIDTVLTHWQHDTHPVHQRIATMTLQACRNVPRVLAFAVNWYVAPNPFWPTTFVAVEQRHWNSKVRALSCYTSEFSRAGAAWVEYQDRETLNYGVRLGVPRAEGFQTVKNLI
jgi:LmbE family N-acetylglucosaminyl deacetylase